MASYEIHWKTSAERELRSIDPQHILRIVNAVDALASNPLPSKCRKLRGSKRDYRIRVGDYRVIYKVDRKGKLITIYRVRHRSEAYRR